MAKFKVHSASEAIRLLGGPRRIATYLGVDERVIPNWRERGFPAHTYLALSEVFDQLDVAIDPDLWGQWRPVVSWAAVRDGRARYLGQRRRRNGRQR